MKKLLTLVLILGMSITWGSGCKKQNILNAPPGVNVQQVANWYQATGAMLTVSEIAKEGPPVLLSLYQAKAIDTEYYVAALKLMKDFDNGGLHAVTVLKASPNNFSASVKTQVYFDVQNMLTAVADFNAQGGTHVKNPAALQTFSELVSSAKLALTLTEQLSGGN